MSWFPHASTWSTGRSQQALCVAIESCPWRPSHWAVQTCWASVLWIWLCTVWQHLVKLICSLVCWLMVLQIMSRRHICVSTAATLNNPTCIVHCFCCHIIEVIQCCRGARWCLKLCHQDSASTRSPMHWAKMSWQPCSFWYRIGCPPMTSAGSGPVRRFCRKTLKSSEKYCRVPGNFL